MCTAVSAGTFGWSFAGYILTARLYPLYSPGCPSMVRPRHRPHSRRMMKTEGGTSIYDVLGEPSTGAEQFLDDEVMCGLLGLDANTTLANDVSTEEAVADPLAFQPIPDGEHGAQRSSEILSLRHIDDFNQASSHIFSPQSCLASPISNEDSPSDVKPQAQQNNRGSEYVFGIGNPASVNISGVYEAAKLEPLRSIHKPRFSRSQANTKLQAGVNNANRASRQNVSQRGRASRADQDASGLEHLLYTPVAVTEGIYGPTVSAPETSGEACHDFSSIPADFLREEHEIIPLAPRGQPSQQETLASANQYHHQKYSKPNAGVFNPLRGESNLAFPGPGIANKAVENVHLGNVESNPFSTDNANQSSALSFMDMFRIDSIPIPHPGDWKSPPLLSGRPQNTGNNVTPQNLKQSKRKAPSKPRVRKPASSKRKLSERDLSLPPSAVGNGSSSLNSGKNGSGSSGGDGDTKKCDDILMPTVDGVNTIAVQPSRFCHICLRRAGRVTLLACGNALEGSCRKVVCEKCFENFGWDWAEALKPNSMWTCTHCRQA